MDDVVIRVRDDGPLVVHGNIRVVDAEGNPLTWDTSKKGCALCRCGTSQQKPFCDGSHRGHFQSRVRAPDANASRES